MANIPEEVISDIISKAKIEEVIGQYMELQRKGNNYVGLCPFHDDHDPSLTVSPAKKMFKCFVCGTGGNVINFVSRFRNLSYPQAIKEVAETIGYDYDFGSTVRTDTFRETTVHKVMKDSVLFCQHMLASEEGKTAREYLMRRGIDEKAQEEYQFGFNPSGNVLYKFLRRKGYRDEDIISAGVAVLTANGIQDFFHDRITIPIHDFQGHPVGFTARSMDPEALSKYINTADTPIFRKSNVLFNYHRAAEGIKREKAAVIAEGPMDVMALSSAGITNAVCALGTAFTKEQLMILKRHCKRLILAFDGDMPGQNAIYKTGKLAQSVDLPCDVINNNTQYDPDEIIRKAGPATLAGMVQKPKNWLEFIIDYFQKKYDLNNYNARKEYALQVSKEIALSRDQIDRDNFTARLAKITGFSRESLNTDPAPEQKNPVARTYERAITQRTDIPDGLTISQWTILMQMLMSREAVETYKEKLGYLPDNSCNKLALHIVEYYKEHDDQNSIDISVFAGEPENQEYASLIYDIQDEIRIRKEYDRKVLDDCIRYIRRAAIDKQIDEKKKQMETYSDVEVISSITEEIRVLKEKKESI